MMGTQLQNSIMGSCVNVIPVLFLKHDAFQAETGTCYGAYDASRGSPAPRRSLFGTRRAVLDACAARKEGGGALGKGT